MPCGVHQSYRSGPESAILRDHFNNGLPPCYLGVWKPVRDPADAGFHFPTFADRLSDLGFVIYPGKVSRTDCFRVGTIGRIFPEDVRDLLRAVEQALAVGSPSCLASPR